MTGDNPIVTTIDELCSRIDAVAEVVASGNAEWTKQLGSFQFQPPIEHLKAMDPCSPEYFEEQYRMYEEITGKTYGVNNELHGAEPFPGVYPYFTRNLEEIGTHLIRVANVVRSLPLKAGARVLELGAGWGNLSLLMAQSGLQVTTLDIEPRFKQIIDERAAAAGVQIEARCDEFSSLDRDAQQYDCVLFFESFHHSRDHIKLLESVQDQVKADGVMVFASEPIWEQLPLPWSLRFDSLALYCIRRFGWFETGFTESYFVDLLMRKGWICSKSELSDIPDSSIFIARRAHGVYNVGELHLPPNHASTWHAPEGKHRWTTGESLLRLPAGEGSVTLQFYNHAPFPQDVRVNVGRHRQAISVPSCSRASVEVACDPNESLLRIQSMTWKPANYGVPDNRAVGIAVEQIVIA